MTAGSFLCGTESGIEVYSTEPKILRKIDGSKIGSIAICEVLPNSSIIALVSGGLQPRFEDNKVVLYDEKKQAHTYCYVVSESVLGVRLSNNRIFIVQCSGVDIFSIGTDAKKIWNIDTSPNPKGLCAVNICPSIRELMMLPGEQGKAIIYDLQSGNTFHPEVYRIFQAHSSEIIAMSTNITGTKLATASGKGTLIRVFDTATGEKLIQFRRGTAYAMIDCISFSDDGNYLCSSSETGTVHLFSFNSTHSVTSYMSYLFLSTKDSFYRSFASFPIPAKTRSMCIFGTNNNIYAITHEGFLYEYKFEDGIACVKEKIVNLHSMAEEDIWFDAESNLWWNFISSIQQISRNVGF